MANCKVRLKARVVTEEDLMGLPRGFRFHPTDEEIVVHYLIPKAMNRNFSAAAIGQTDFNKCEPWDLPNMGDTERYYYCHRDRKYPTGLRTNRATKAGYWKATGKDKEIYKGTGDGRELVGMKKTLVFYTGRAPSGEKTNWVMHEYRLQPQFTPIPKDDGWVVSRVFHKSTGGGMHKRSCIGPFSPIQAGSDSFSADELIRDDFDSLPPLVDPSAVAHQDQKAVAPLSYGFSYSTDAYDDPAFSFYESLFKTPDDQLNVMEEYKCKVEQAISFSQQEDMMSSDVEVSYDDLFSSTLSSMPDLSKLWD